ncbi:MAG TPA: hypothetical protein VFV96_07720 [Verrucomicrobiae bacterium]|nr:hypothetical protein [Verrucomicrobiae bacterium]
MISTSSNKLDSASQRAAWWPWIFILVLGIICALAISRESFWIDELYTPRAAEQPTLTAWWKEVFYEKGSNLQAPLYMLWIWVCGQIFGTSELALRAVNLLWFAPALLALTQALVSRPTLQTTALLTTAMGPMTWYYLNEARPYAMQLGTSLYLFAVIIHWRLHPDAAITRERWRVLSFATALVLLCGSSLLAMILAAAPLFTVLVMLPLNQLRALGRTFLAVWAVTLTVLFCMGVYYLWTLHQGARATSLATTNLKNLAFIAYELLGFDGLGPGRLEIRSGGLSVFKVFMPVLVFYAGVTAILLFFGGQELWRKMGAKKLAAILLAALAPAGFIFATGALVHFRVLGRHMMCLAPLVFLLLAVGAAATWRRRRWGKITVTVFFTLYFTSSLALRFASRHQKDDYRGAAAIAKRAIASGKSVWWNAEQNGAVYYQVPFSTGNTMERGKAYYLMNPSEDQLTATTPPDLIITSRPDVYDGDGALGKYLSEGNYRTTSNLTAFVIWKRE